MVEYAEKRSILAVRERAGIATYVIDTLGSCWLAGGVAEAEIDGLPPQRLCFRLAQADVGYAAFNSIIVMR